MSRRYDSRTTTFSPEGRLFQVEYAMEAINNAAAAVGVLAKDGIVLAVEKRSPSKLLAPPKTSEKIYKLDDHVICAVAGLTSDANILINFSRLVAQRYRFAYQEPQPLEEMIKLVCNYKQGYTQYGGLRPFGVSFLYAGWDRHYGFQLYHSDPSGNYGGWKATAIGSNHQNAQSFLKSEFKDDMSMDDALELVAKTLAKTMDVSPTAERMEFCMISRTGDGIVHRLLPAPDVEALIARVSAALGETA